MTKGRFLGISEMPIDPERWHYLRPQDLLFGMDGSAWVWVKAKAWRKGVRDDTPVKIRRTGESEWVVALPEDVSINVGDVVLDTENYWPIDIQEERAPLNHGAFAIVSQRFESMGPLTRAVASGSRTLAVPGKRRTVMGPVVDRSDDQIKIMSMSEGEAKKLKYLSGQSIAEIVMDEVPESLDENRTETLNVADLIANKFEPKGP